MSTEDTGASKSDGREDSPRSPVVTPMPDGSVHIDSIGPGETVFLRPEGTAKFVNDDEEYTPDGAGSWHYGWHYSDRKIPFPWGLAVFFLVLFILAGLGIAWAVQSLGLF